MEEKHHWKNYTNTDYIGAYSLNGADLTVKIKKVAQEQVTGQNGKKEMCLVAHLEGQKPMILNRTNAKTISRLYGSPFVEDWIGRLITLYPTTTSVGGETVECLRIRQTVPQQAKKDYSKQIQALRECKTIEDLKSAYSAMTKDEQVATVLVKDEIKTQLQ